VLVAKKCVQSNASVLFFQKPEFTAYGAKRSVAEGVNGRQKHAFQYLPKSCRKQDFTVKNTREYRFFANMTENFDNTRIHSGAIQPSAPPPPTM
jgi:hypothetical protein